MAYWLTKYTNKGHNTCMLSKHFYISDCTFAAGSLTILVPRLLIQRMQAESSRLIVAATDVEMLGKHACVVPLVLYFVNQYAISTSVGFLRNLTDLFVYFNCG